ncbi:TPA: TonB family protein [Enterobacter soli]|uniref:Protein TonB n=1 Tax=Enterobacter soli TaxID=885040 RepID=A0AAW8H614_9ENTR|nr:TonB family protein [Enterobacter soli]MDQ2255364.1 TonB family protein [Enterobacter soli]MDQ2338214.1 TonB family protein [Enterobacter soli]HEE9789003.1 TonB family protein [Enterobacter soli]
MKRLTMALTLAMLAPGCAYKQIQSGQEHVTGDIKAAKSSTWDLPYYPVKALAGQIEGVVRASYTVDTKGCAENIKIISAQPADVFERETIRAMNKWCGMEPTSLPKIITITFRLNGGASMEEVPLTLDK